jgi:hypothetical protein
VAVLVVLRGVEPGTRVPAEADEAQRGAPTRSADVSVADGLTTDSSRPGATSDAAARLASAAATPSGWAITVCSQRCRPPSASSGAMRSRGRAPRAPQRRRLRRLRPHLVERGDGLVPLEQGRDQAGPRAGRSPSYVVRQLHDFKHGARAGASSVLMKPAVSRSTLDDIIALAAYAASFAP